ncbi:MAG TPA: ATP-grasp domain-containing protein [Actinospica sp.]|jgi:biotin carboxylase|nr:ATP-grasp domain-containing protein [Actinospica sp.]
MTDHAHAHAPAVAIVDAYASATRLAAAFDDAGYACVRVQSSREVPAVYRSDVDLTRYTGNIVHDEDFDATVAALAAVRPVAVIAGGEQGVEFADRLGEALGLDNGNGTELSYARRSKHAQTEVVARAGLATARQLVVTDPGQLVRWHREIGGRIVVKPVRSARNDGVSFCDTPEDSAAAYRAITGTRSVFGVPNEGVVAQEYLTGTEYVVNTVSCRGRHRATDVWRYTKINVNGVADRINGVVSLPEDDHRRDALTAYSFAVLDALQIRYGPVHLEIMLTPDGPRLVEAGARLCGADVARYAQLATGESQVERTVQAYVDPEKFLADLDSPYRLRHHAAMAFLAAPVRGILRGYPLMGLVEALESYHDRSVKVTPGARLHRTVDDSSEPLMIGLVNPDPAALEKDFATVCYLDGYGFYDVVDAEEDEGTDTGTDTK